MNLTTSPSLTQLEELYAAADDNSPYGNRVVVCKSGEVLVISCSEENEKKIRDSKNTHFFSDVYSQGEGYVGKDAAADKEYMQNEMKWLLKHWDAGTQGFVALA
jgi:hypothetical protein